MILLLVTLIPVYCDSDALLLSMRRYTFFLCLIVNGRVDMVLQNLPLARLGSFSHEPLPHFCTLYNPLRGLPRNTGSRIAANAEVHQRPGGIVVVIHRSHQHKFINHCRNKCVRFTTEAIHILQGAPTAYTVTVWKSSLENARCAYNHCPMGLS